MISILIPIYNFDVCAFVNKLHTQATKASIPFEIILMDDASTAINKEKNSSLKSLPCLKYIQLETNVGRSKIRNLLANEAIYETLLFLDCDSDISSEFYLSNYINECTKNVVVCGGTIYQQNAPTDKKMMLRWKYGKNREVKTALERNNNPNSALTTNNFLISKNIFNQIKFEETIVKYGHEDTLFGYKLKKNKITVKHIDNPLIHVGLENADVFMHKTNQGIENLIEIIELHKIENDFFSDVRLLNYFYFINKLKLRPAFQLLNKIVSQHLFNHLIKSDNPKLILFDIYKLLYINRFKLNK